jgi:tetratricopeptide (TPR) repeat protein
MPFSADTPFSIIHDQIYSPLPLPRTVNPKVPESVERVLMKALAKERSDRFDNVESLVDAFIQATKGESLQEVWSVPVEPIPMDTVGFGEELLTPDDESTLPKDAPSRAVSLEIALQRVEENPDDPYAHMDLAFAYVDAGMEKEAIQEINNVRTLAEGDAGFLIDFANQLDERGLWLLALDYYVRALKSNDGNLPGVAVKGVHRAIYFAAQDERAKDLLFVPIEEHFNIIGIEVLEAGRARYKWFYESPQAAAELINPRLNAILNSQMGGWFRLKCCWNLD